MQQYVDVIIVLAQHVVVLHCELAGEKKKSSECWKRTYKNLILA